MVSQVITRLTYINLCLLINNFRFLPYRTIDYTKITNDKCKEVQCREILTADLLLTTNTSDSSEGPPKLELKLGPSSLDYFNFVTLGIQTLKGKRIINETIEARQIELRPKVEKKEMWFSIDKENFEAKPIRITLLPQMIPLFCKKELN